MFTTYVGLYADLPPAKRRAIERLTVRRYVDDIYRLSQHLERTQDLLPGSLEFERSYEASYERIRAGLAQHDDRTYVTAILLPDPGGGWVALACMRFLLGRRTDAIAQTIGHADSSIPSNMLLRGFRYPRLPDFDPELVAEAEITEISRFVTADHATTDRLVRAKALPPADATALRRVAFGQLIVNIYRSGNPSVRVEGWIFNVKPKLAYMLKLRGLKLVPLFADGAEPTTTALEHELHAPYFCRWPAELQRFVPDPVHRAGTAAAVRYLASRDPRTWLRCEVSLPYLVVHDFECRRTIDQLETGLSASSCR